MQILLLKADLIKTGVESYPAWRASRGNKASVEDGGITEPGEMSLECGIEAARVGQVDGETCCRSLGSDAEEENLARSEGTQCGIG